MENQVFNNEIPFCKVTSEEAKKELERVFLRHRISYFVEWPDKSWFQRVFGSKKFSCVVKINNADFARARELVSGIRDIKLRDHADGSGSDPVRDLAMEKEAEKTRRKKASANRRPVIRETSSKDI